MKKDIANILIGANSVNIIWCTVGVIAVSPYMVIPLLGSVVIILGCLSGIQGKK